MNACSNNPCYNGGNCLLNGNSFICQCPNGFSGNNCQQISQPSCLDSDTYNCPFYANNNLCSGFLNGISVRSLCPRSCKCCNTYSLPQPQPVPIPIQEQCTDKYSNCVSLVASNSCNSYPIYDLCKRSCKLC
jgi:hypothetical protein